MEPCTDELGDKSASARALGLFLGVGAAVFLAASPSAADGVSLPARRVWTFAASGRPAGVLARLDVLSARAPISLGAHASYRTISVELGAGPALYLFGGAIIATARATLEPGAYLTVAPGTTLAQARAIQDPAGRRPGLRYGASVLLNANVRNDRFWLYNRTTVWARTRPTPEYDILVDSVVAGELGTEVATALMVNVARHPRRRVWLYAEHTHAWLAGAGTVIARPSIGMISEGLLPRVAFDLDLNYGLREGPLQGPGFILAVWVSSD